MLLIACTDSAPESHATSARDSAGIEIVEVRGAFPEWRLAGDTLLRIGVVSGEDAYQFDVVRFAAQLSHGGVVVADAGAREVRWFDSAGTHVASFGREGEGPGEFATISDAQLTAGDTIVVHDMRSQRLTWVAPGGAGWREQPLVGEHAGRVIRAGDELLVAVTESEPAVYSSAATRHGSTVRFLSLGEDTDTITAIPGPDNGVMLFQPGRAIGFPVPFSAGPLYAHSGGLIVVTDAAHPEIRQVDEEGRIVRIIRLEDLKAQPVGAEERDRLLEHTESVAVEAGRPVQEALEWRNRELSVLEPTDMMALFDRMVAGADGRIWIRRYRPVWAQREPQQWLVLEVDGSPAGSIELGPQFVLMQPGNGLITGVVTDSLDVEYVVVLAVDEDG